MQVGLDIMLVQAIQRFLSLMAVDLQTRHLQFGIVQLQHHQCGVLEIMLIQEIVVEIMWRICGTVFLAYRKLDPLLAMDPTKVK